jgi:hypothetical protein
MSKLHTSLIIAAGLLVGCSTVAEDGHWPKEMSFVILDETPDTFVFTHGPKIEPTVNRVVLLPIVENYLWKGKRHFLALADPIVVEPGKELLSKTMASLETNRQAVRDCIVLAPGYCPGTLQPVINYSGKYKDKDVWLVELAKITAKQFQASVQCITNDLNTPILRVQGERQVSFEDAIKAGKLLNNAELKGPLLHSDGEFRNTYVLWSVPDGTKVSICLSSNGWAVLKRELVEPAFKTP